MDVRQGCFTVKLHEMEREYERMQSRLRLCQEEDHQKILREMQLIRDENRERDASLEKTITGSRSPSVSELADAQLTYSRAVEQGLQRVLTDSPNLEDCAEKLALYAEYAIDFASLAMRHALLSVFIATDLQLGLEEQWAELKSNIAAQEETKHE